MCNQISGIRSCVLLSQSVVGLFIFISSQAFSVESGVKSKISANLLQDSNIYRTTEDTSDNLFNVAPELSLTGMLGKQVFEAVYKGNYTYYQDNSTLNYYDHDLGLSAKFDHSIKFGTAFKVRYQDQIEQPGTTNALSNQLSEFNQRQSLNISAETFYGTKQSIGQVVIKYDRKQLEYSNNEQAFRDYNSDKFTSSFFYRVAPKTRLLLEASSAKLAYQNTQFFDLSSSQNTYLAGVEWNATAITSSIFKIGYQDVDYKNESLNDLSGLSYYLDMFWKPNTYTLLKIGASRTARESAEQSVGGYISSEYDVSLQHEFTSRTKFEVGYRYTDFDYDNNQSRKDELKNITAKLSYQSKYWLQLNAEYKNTQRSSILEFYNYEANIVSLGAVASF